MQGAPTAASICARHSRRSAGGVAHDSNDLLVVIEGNAELLARARLRCEDDRDSARQIVEAALHDEGASGGTALGLSGVYGIVEQCRGTIEVASTPGAGASFTIRLPSSDAAEVGDAMTGEESGSERGDRSAPAARIAVVEDQRAIRRLLRRMLERAGHEVVEAEDGVDALETIAALDGGIDLLITDLMMPRLDGPSLAARLRETTPSLRVIYTSGYSADDVSERERGRRTTDFLPKPFREAELHGKVAKLLAEEPSGA